MAGYTVIADVGNTLVRLLREHMVPEVILHEDEIGLCSPADKGDFRLGLYLYDIKESEEVFENGMRLAGPGLQKRPSKYLDLYYMLTAYSMSDVKFRSEEEHRILGRAMQVFMDYGLLQENFYGDEQGRYQVKIEQMRLNYDEKMKLWNMPNVPYRLSVYYKVFPIELVSTREKNVQRVKQVDMELVEKERRMGMR